MKTVGRRRGDRIISRQPLQSPGLESRALLALSLLPCRLRGGLRNEVAVFSHRGHRARIVARGSLVVLDEGLKMLVVFLDGKVAVQARTAACDKAEESKKKKSRIIKLS